MPRRDCLPLNAPAFAGRTTRHADFPHRALQTSTPRQGSHRSNRDMGVGLCVPAMRYADDTLVCRPLPSTGITPLPRCRVGGGAPEGAGLRPPLKRHVRFSRMPLSRRHVGEMREKGNSGVDPLRTRQVEPGPQSPRTMMYGFFACRRTDPPHRPSSSGVPARPSCLRPPPSPTHSSRRSRGHAGFAALQVLCSGPTTGRASRPTSLPLIGLLTPVLLGPCQSS